MIDGAGNWFQTITVGGVGIWTIVAGVAVALIRQKPIMQRLFNEREGNLLKERALEMKRMRSTIVRLEAELRVAGHIINNVETSLDMFLEMVEADPSRAKDWAARIRAKREEQKLAISAERAGIYAEAIRQASEDDEAQKAA